MLDHDSFGARNRRRRYRNRAKRSDNVSSFLIFSSSIEWGIKSAGRRNVPREPQENSERLFSFGIVSSKFERGTQLAMRYSMIA
jgi:hypothetical protein